MHRLNYDCTWTKQNRTEAGDAAFHYNNHHRFIAGGESVVIVTVHIPLNNLVSVASKGVASHTGTNVILPSLCTFTSCTQHKIYITLSLLLLFYCSLKLFVALKYAQLGLRSCIRRTWSGDENPSRLSTATCALKILWPDRRVGASSPLQTPRPGVSLGKTLNLKFVLIAYTRINMHWFYTDGQWGKYSIDANKGDRRVKGLLLQFISVSRIQGQCSLL